MTPHPFELVVFDCDGVLVDSEVISVRVDQRVLADLGWELELDEIVERFVGRSEAHFIATLEERLGMELGGRLGPEVRALVPDGVRARARGGRRRRGGAR